MSRGPKKAPVIPLGDRVKLLYPLLAHNSLGAAKRPSFSQAKGLKQQTVPRPTSSPPLFSYFSDASNMETNTRHFHSLGHTKDQSMVHMETLQILGSSKGTPFSLVSNQRPRGQHKPSFLCSWTPTRCLLHAESCAGPQETQGMGNEQGPHCLLGGFLGLFQNFPLSWFAFFFCLLFCFVYTLNLLSNVDLLSLVEILNLAKAEIYLVLLTMIVPYQPQCLAHSRDSETGYS